MREQDRITLGYFEKRGQRTVCICMAAINYRKALSAERRGRPLHEVISLLQTSLTWTMEDRSVGT